MHSQDFDEFSRLLDDAYDLIGSGANKVISGGAKALFFNAMAPYSLDVFRGALSAHCLDKVRGRFTPKPADIIEQIEGQAKKDGRLSADEAWAIALRSTDESETVVWTDEIAKAYAICASIFPDEVGARMAFKDSYNRCVLEAREARRPANWIASLGWDVDKREAAIQRALTAGLIGMSQAVALLPNYAGAQEDGPKATPEGLKKLKEKLAELKLQRIADNERFMSLAENERLVTLARKQEIAAQVEAAQRELGQ